MDPLSALSVATAVVQFIDFASKLIVTTSRIRNSPEGYDDAVSEVRAASERLITLNDNVKSGCDLQPVNSSNIAIKKLCSDCNDVAYQILKRSQALSVGADAGKRDAVVAALKTTWSQKEMSGLQKRLDSYRRQISEHIITVLLAQATELQKNQRRLGDVSAASHRETQDMIRQVQVSLKHGDSSPKNVTKAISIKNRLQSGVTPDGRLVSEQGTLGIFEVQMRHALSYITIDARKERIDDAHKATLDWVFRSESVNHPRYCKLNEWLTISEGLYWITGKPGSGKSTLIKFIAEDPRLLQQLGVWAGDNTLKILQFYSWNAGTTHQASFEGLLRTFLYQIIENRTDLVTKLFPMQYETLLLLGESQAGVPDLGIDDLQKAFGRYIQLLEPNMNVFVLIDGLDEFTDDHAQMIEFVNRLIAPRVKVCVSSRPWSLFRDAFQAGPSLTMQDLTRLDIRAYVETEFASSPGYIPRRIAEPEATESLLSTLVEMADGVFLWVRWVVSTLMAGFSEGASISDLRKRLDAIPLKLEDLYQSIFDSLDPQKQAQFSEYFQKVRLMKQFMKGFREALILAWADESIDDNLQARIGSIGEESLRAKIELCRRRINESCKGLIDIPSDPDGPSLHAGVFYLHRTVQDYWHRQENWTNLLAASGSGFHPHNQLLGAFSAFYRSRHDPSDPKEFLFTLKFLAIAPIIKAPDYARSASSIACQVRLLDNLRAVIDTDRLRAIPQAECLAWTTKILTPSDSFLEFICTMGLTDYVDTYMKVTEEHARAELSQHLLEVLITHGRVYYSDRRNMVDLLTNYRVDLKARMKFPFKYNSNEEEVIMGFRRLNLVDGLRFKLEHMMDKSEWKGKEAVMQVILGYVEAFLKAGADPIDFVCTNSKLEGLTNRASPEACTQVQKLLSQIPQLAEAQTREEKKLRLRKYLPWKRK